MRCMLRNKRKIYLCNWYESNSIKKYKNPIELMVNYQPTNSDGDLIALGQDYPMYIRMKCNIIDGKKFNAGDRVYIQKIPTTTFNGLCKDADYEVTSDPLIFLDSVEVNLRKLSGK